MDTSSTIWFHCLTTTLTLMIIQRQIILTFIRFQSWIPSSRCRVTATLPLSTRLKLVDITMRWQDTQHEFEILMKLWKRNESNLFLQHLFRVGWHTHMFKEAYFATYFKFLQYLIFFTETIYRDSQWNSNKFYPTISNRLQKLQHCKLLW